MTTEFSAVFTSADPILYAASSDSDIGSLPLLLLLSGFLFYGYIFMRYRNADKRHRHERETEAETHNVERYDNYVRTRRGLSNRRMSGANNKRVDGALNKTGTAMGAFRRAIRR